MWREGLPVPLMPKLSSKHKRWKAIRSLRCMFVSDHLVSPRALIISFQRSWYQRVPFSNVTHNSPKNFQRILKSKPWRPLVKRRVPSPRPNSPSRPSEATISFAAATARQREASWESHFIHMHNIKKRRTVANVTLVSLSVGLDHSERVRDGVRNDGS